MHCWAFAIWKIQKELRKIINDSHDDYFCEDIWPLTVYITSPFGVRIFKSLKLAILKFLHASKTTLPEVAKFPSTITLALPGFAILNGGLTNGGGGSTEYSPSLGSWLPKFTEIINGF